MRIQGLIYAADPILTPAGAPAIVVEMVRIRDSRAQALRDMESVRAVVFRERGVKILRKASAGDVVTLRGVWQSDVFFVPRDIGRVDLEPTGLLPPAELLELDRITLRDIDAMLDC